MTINDDATFNGIEHDTIVFELVSVGSLVHFVVICEKKNQNISKCYTRKFYNV